MARTSSAAASGVRGRRGAVAGAGDWIERLARAGLAARGIVHVLVGVLAVQAAFGSGGAGGPSEALQSVQDEWWGTALLAVIAVGLVGYAIWRFVAAAFDPEDDGIGKRLLSAGRGLIYGGLAFQAARLALGDSGGGGASSEASDWTARLMSQPFGPWLVGVVGAGVIIYALYQLYRAWTIDLDDQLELGRLSRTGRRWVVRTGRAGTAARGIVLGLIGWFFIHAAIRTDPGEARGLGGALRALQEQPYGPYLLTAVAAGLIAFGAYQMLRARYRVIRTPG